MNKKSFEKYYSDSMKVKFPWWGPFLDRIVKNYSRIEVASEIDKGKGTCLDLACGKGELLNKFLKERYTKLMGIDISPKLISQAIKKGSKKTVFKVATVEDFVETAIKRRSRFDTVFMLAILEHIPWPFYLVESVSEIVKRGGSVIVEVPNISWFPHRFALLRGRFPETAPTYGVISGVHDEHLRFFTVDTLDEIFTRAGFKRKRIECAGRLRFIKRLWIELFSPDIVAAYTKK